MRNQQHGNEGGFALLLALFAVLALTVLAVGALSVANTDLIVSQNHRKRIITYKTAVSGLEEGRNFIRQISEEPSKVFDLSSNWQNYAADDCYPLERLVTDAGWSDAPVFDSPLSSGGIDLGQPEACISKNIYFSGPAPGYSMESGTSGGGQRTYQMVALDIQSRSQGSGSNLTRSLVGGLVSFVCEAPCGR